tara:strand:+ start:1684 stop:2103 length:420 start_codon:yes stop_codon:yes gene_type:complete
MAAIRGDVGKIMFEASGGTEADIGSLRSWSLEITKDTIETTKMGATFKTRIGGLIDGSGSCELLYDPTEGAAYQAFIDDIITTGDPGDALIELFPDANQSAKKISCAIIITNASYGATLGEVQIINISFETNGTITSAI